MPPTASLMLAPAAARGPHKSAWKSVDLMGGGGEGIRPALAKVGLVIASAPTAKCHVVRGSAHSVAGVGLNVLSVLCRRGGRRSSWHRLVQTPSDSYRTRAGLSTWRFRTYRWRARRGGRAGEGGLIRGRGLCRCGGAGGAHGGPTSGPRGCGVTFGAGRSCRSLSCGVDAGGMGYAPGMPREC